MDKISLPEAEAIAILLTEKQPLAYQSNLDGFAAPGASKHNVISVETANLLINKNIIVAKREAVQGKEVLEQIDLAKIGG
ncbi:hypothetical protein KCM76_22805 [Zooshikella marina]|uniref:hypothetical protein n=1 Tax=Zooshikella ganghwensis TaxID=202772 RepID=UPI001BAF2FC0|nr:hypothetical protein [Zooshikella ganghwensis]MBU2708842.1 hypothetical protein [Zooshikella ganghwensis]